jgi:perosamine synthetase
VLAAEIEPARTIPWWEPRIGPGEAALVADVLASHYVNEGEMTARFERALADLLGVQHVIAVTSGTVALALALRGLEIGPGDEVIVPDVTFIATANAVRLAGATPVLADVDPRTLTLDPEAMTRVLSSRTRAVIPVHVSGRAAAMTDILEIAWARGLAVVEDAAEALGSRHHGRALGTLGDAGCFSFSPNKTITTGQGGAVATDDNALAARLRALKDQGRPVRGTGGDDLHPTLGFNFKLTNLQAAVGLGQLAMLEDRLARQQRTYRLYAEGLRDLPALRLPGFAAGECPQWVDALVEGRDALDRHLADQRMHCRRFWLPLHTQAPYRAPDEHFPHSTRLMPQALWLPSAFTLADDDVAAVCAAIRAFFRA